MPFPLTLVIPIYCPKVTINRTRYRRLSIKINYHTGNNRGITWLFRLIQAN